VKYHFFIFLSLLHGLVQHSGPATTCALNSSGSSGTSSFSASGSGQAGQPSSSFGPGSGLPPSKDNDQGSNQPGKPQTNESKAGSHKSDIRRRFRCCLNAILPDVFCVNENAGSFVHAWGRDGIVYKFKVCHGLKDNQNERVGLAVIEMASMGETLARSRSRTALDRKCARDGKR